MEPGDQQTLRTGVDETPDAASRSPAGHEVNRRFCLCVLHQPVEVPRVIQVLRWDTSCCNSAFEWVDPLSPVSTVTGDTHSPASLRSSIASYFNMSQNVMSSQKCQQALSFNWAWAYNRPLEKSLLSFLPKGHVHSPQLCRCCPHLHWR